MIYKRGDDLRQDQVVVQIFSLMDRLLKRENLDLKLTAYRWGPSPPASKVAGAQSCRSAALHTRCPARMTQEREVPRLHLAGAEHMVAAGMLERGLLVRRVLPTSPEDGLIECIPSTALARVLAEHKSIHRYWALYNADPSGALYTRELATWAEV